MTDNVSRITSRVRELILTFIPPDTPTHVIQNYQSYLLRILSSRISIPSIEDESTVRQALQKSLYKLAEEQNLNTITLNNASLRLHELLHNLGMRKALQKPLAVCSLLAKISKNNNQENGGVLSSMDTLAKSREKFKASENAGNRRGGGAMEIEHSAVQPEPLAVSTILNQTQFQSKVLKIGEKSGNKENAGAGVNVPESDLLRDILFAFQGIDGNCIYYSMAEEGFVIRNGILLSSPVRKMALQLCEMGWLYKKIIGFIGEANLESRGLVHQSLCYALKEELNEYYRLIAVLENLKDSNMNQGENDAFMGNDKSPLNLRKLYLWSLESFERLKWMCVICDACRKVKGSVIISTIYGYAKQGSPSVQGLVNRVLKQVLAPFSHFLKQWVYHGELNDQFEEFFIKIDPYVKDQNLWNDKYILNKEMVPAFMDIKIAESILTTGKSVNFMRKCCNYSDWVLEIEPIDLSSSMLVNVNQTLNFREFEEWVSTANQATSKVLLAVLLEKFKLVQHFETIKRFLLFGQGDFIQYLMDLLIKELSHPATSVYRHNLLSLLETAIRSSNAQHIKNEFLSRIDVKLLDGSPGDSGWDIFTLTYNLESPLTTIMNTKIMAGYLQIFNFLWRVKRIEHSMTSIWLQQMKGASMLNRIKEFRMYIHKCNILRNEMIHFMGNLFNYLMIEVIEGSWKIFMDELQEAKNLDEVIKYHEKFVSSILEKALLTPKNEKIYRHVVKLFDYIYRFKCTQEILLTSVQEEDQKRRSKKSRMETMEIMGDEYSEAGSYDTERRGESIEIESAENKATRSRITIEALNNLKNVWKDYKKSFLEFMELLKDGNHVGKLRFLTFRLDFNEYYASIDPRHLEIRDRNIDSFRVNRSHDNYGEQEEEMYTSELIPRPEPMVQSRGYGDEQRMVVEEAGQRGTMYDREFGGSMRSEGRDMSFLKNFSYGDQFSDNRSILKSFNYGGLNKNDNPNK